MRRSLIPFVAAAVLGGCLTPTDIAIDHYVTGQLAVEGKDYQAALAELSLAIRVDPTLSIAHEAIGDIHRQQGNHLQAAGAYENACQTNPYSFRPHYNLGWTYQALARAAHSAQAAAEYIHKAVVVYLRAVTLRPDDFDANLNLAACFFQEGKYPLAEQYCKAAIRINPDSAFAQANLGTIYDAQGDAYKAIRAYKDSLELDVHQPALLLNLGATYQRLGRVKEALHTFQLAAKEEPLSPAPWELIGGCHYRLKDYDEALRSYGEAIRRDPRSAAGHRGTGVVYLTKFVIAGRQDTALRDKALAALNKSLELDSRQDALLRLVQKYSPRPAAPEL